MASKEIAVRDRLAKIIPVVEFASLCALVLFLRWSIVPDRIGIFLVFLLPIAFGLHVIEEFVFPGGFIRWDNIFRPRYSDTHASFYVKVNIFPGIASLLLVLGAFDYDGKYSLPGIRGWLVFVTFLTWNALFHVRGAVHTRRYSSGMATALVLYVPLTIVSYIHFKNLGVIDIPSMILCAGIALTIQPILDLIKNRRLRKTSTR